MLQFLRTTEAQAVIWVTALLMLAVIGYYIVRRFRDLSGDDNPTANELLSNFRELHQEGDISDKEFRTIKTVLKEKLENELNNAGDEG